MLEIICSVPDPLIEKVTNDMKKLGGGTLKRLTAVPEGFTNNIFTPSGLG